MNLRENKRLYVLFLGAMLAGLLVACGASEETRLDSAGAPPSAATFDGIDKCSSCHSVQTAEWLATLHANLDPSNPSNLNYAGIPATGSVTAGACTDCHDWNSDSANLTPGYTGDMARPIVGCEACHGEGSNHSGPGGAIGRPYREDESELAAQYLTATTMIDVTAIATTTPTTINVTATNTTGTTTINVTAANTFTRPAGSFITNGFTAGMIITTSGFTDAANNGVFTIASVTATTVKITASTLVTESGTGDELIAASYTFTRPAGSFITNGFTAGMTITTSGFTNAKNNGVFTVADVTASTIKITASALVTETGTGDELITASDTFTRAAGDFTADGFIAGRVITTSGFAKAQNNGSFVIASVSASNITVTSTSLVAESGTGDESIVSSAILASSQFNTCTACHELLDTTAPIPPNTVAAAAHRVGGTSPTGNGYIITDTHFATPGDYSAGANSNDITGYPLEYSSETACTDCHYPHGPITVHREWANSAHADKTALGAWAHYKWSDANRAVCQRCHTTTGYAAYAGALESGNTSLATGIFAGTNPPLAVVAEFKPEMLTCKGCHKDNKGRLRNPGPITANYNYASGGTTYATVSYTFPDLSYSNICMACHTGRENGESIANLAASFNFANQSFINSHYLTGGATLFAVSGYEFPGRSYENLNTFLHDKIGSEAIPRTGTRGPCIGCHMSRPAGNGDHLFMPVVRNTGTPTIIDSVASEVCIVCHITSNTVIKDIVQDQKNEYREALEALEAQLADAGFHFYEAHPYFYTSAYNTLYTETGLCTQNQGVKNWQTGGTSLFLWSGASCVSSTNTAGTSGTGKHNMGSAFNFNMLHHDAGAYVHNRYYVKRLIYDSIDWLDDNALNYSVGATLTDVAGIHNGQSWQAGAIAYLLPNGVLGYNAERP